MEQTVEGQITLEIKKALEKQTELNNKMKAEYLAKTGTKNNSELEIMLNDSKEKEISAESFHK